MPLTHRGSSVWVLLVLEYKIQWLVFVLMSDPVL